MNAPAIASTHSRRLGLAAGLIQCASLLGLAFLVSAVFGPRPLWAVVADGKSLVWQLCAGSAIGLAVATLTLIATFKIPALQNFRIMILEFPNRADFGGWNPLWLGLCAGLGEEALLRGALQPLLGIWWTAMLFALAHYGTGGFKSMNLMKWGYALFLFLTSLMLGLVLTQIGLVAAVSAHSSIDALIFFKLREVARRHVPIAPCASVR